MFTVFDLEITGFWWLTLQICPKFNRAKPFLLLYCKKAAHNAISVAWKSTFSTSNKGNLVEILWVMIFGEIFHIIFSVWFSLLFSHNFFQKMTAAVYVGGPFHRVRDKRLVRQVVSAQHQPHHWLPMDITATECKLMEVKKFSAEFYEIDVK